MTTRERDLILSKAAVLAEALPWLQEFHGKTVVVKYGGNAMTDESLKRAFAEDIVFLRYVGMRPVAVGVSGEDAHLFSASKRLVEVDGEQVDIGLVGDIHKVSPEFVSGLLDDGLIPVVSTVAVGRDGQSYNVNADTAASALAVALGAEKLVVLTDVEGLYKDFGNSDEVIDALTATELADLLPSLSSGMIPKMEACLRAVQGGVRKAHVLDGRVPHALLLEVFTNEGVGTMVTP